MNALLFAVSTILLSAPQTPPTGNVGVVPKGNVGTYPRGNVGVYPRGNVGVYPRGNVGVYPRGNVDAYPRGNVDNVPDNPLVPNAGSRSKRKDDDKAKSNADSDTEPKSKKAKGKTGAKSKSGDDANRPGVTGPIIVGAVASTAAVIEDLERVRDRLNSVGYDYQGRRASAVNHVTHAIHILRFGKSDPNPDASFLPTGNKETRTVSDLSLRVAQGELRAIAARLRTSAYIHGSAAAAAVERAIRALDVALKPV